MDIAKMNQDHLKKIFDFVKKFVLILEVCRSRESLGLF